jgi:hypothetical protein
MVSQLSVCLADDPTVGHSSQDVAADESTGQAVQLVYKEVGQEAG